MIAGFGLVNKDIVAVVPHWERDQKVEAVHLFEQVGGPVPVALSAMARLGRSGKIVFFGVVGDDRDGSDVADLLLHESVEPRLQRAEAVATSRSLVLLDQRDGSRTLANFAGELPPRAFTTADEAQLRSARLLHLDGRDLSGSLQAAQWTKAGNGLVSLDLGTMRPGREALIQCCDIVIASKKGGAGAFPDARDDPAEQVRRFLAMGVRIAGVTLGANGVVIAEQEGDPLHLPACLVASVVDTCGAGDLFHGAFLYALLEGACTTDAAQFAQAAVAVRIQRYGNRTGLPHREEIDVLLTR